MTQSAERELYERDHAAWVRYAAPRIRDLYRDADAQTKREVWARCSPELRDEIERVRHM